MWEKVTGPPGVTVYAESLDACVPMYFDASLEDVRGNPDAALQRGVPVHDGEHLPVELPLTLQAKTSQAVVITGVKVKVLSNTALPASGVIVNPDGCGGGMTPRVFDVDLTATPVPVQPVASGDGETVDFPLKVSDSDPEQLSLQLDPGDHDVRFTVQVEWVADGEYGSEVLDNNGLGYRVMGNGDIPAYDKAELYR
ncbi:hypothetical protein AB0L99_45155 [Streptomyces sp. NPDC051954]|uniref:hypothetical protein n=1 Tax=Streptomyces sp. NPDC051954 TaxID=3155524 RepID=UPI0034124BAE